LRKNCPQKQVIEGKIKARTKGKKEWKVGDTTSTAEPLVTQPEKLSPTSYFSVPNQWRTEWGGLGVLPEIPKF
jgi:hypothetical protein